jgi:hypothetical protein
MAYKRNPASLSYAYQDDRDRTIHCEIAFDVIEADPAVGYRGEVAFRGVMVTEVVCHDGERIKTSDNSWWLPLDDHAEAYASERDDWRELAWEQWKETEI